MPFRSVTRPFTNPAIQQLLHLVLLALFIAIAYYPSLDVPFIFDDFPNIVANPAVHPEKAADLIKVLHSPVSPSRPLALLSFAVNYLFGYLNVFGYHLVNILIHIANAVLLYQITATLLGMLPAGEEETKSLYPRQAIAFWAATLWALNPVQTQAVTYIVQRMTSMAAFFYLGAIYCFVRWRQGKLSDSAAFFLVSACFLLAMASKEFAVTLPLAFLLLDSLCFSEKISRRQIVAVLFILLGLAGLCAFYLRSGLPDWLARYPNRNFSPWERIMTEWRVVWHYLSLFVLPLPSRLHLAYNPEVSRSLIQPWTTLAGLLAMLTTWFLTWRSRRAFPTSAFAVFFFFLVLSVESSFLNLELAFIHRLYLPSAFLLLGMLCLLPRTALRRATIPLLLVLALWSFWTITRNTEWTQANSFWNADLERGASPGHTLNNRAAALIDSGNYQETVGLIQQGLADATMEERKILLYNQGTALFMLKQYDMALSAFQQVAREYEPLRQTYLFIGQCFVQLGKKEKARNLATKLLAVKGTSYQGKILSANILSSEGKFSEAENILLQALEQKDSAQLDQQLKFRLELAAIYLKHGRIKEAYNSYLDIVRLFPQNYFAWKQIYLMLQAGGDVKGAETVKHFLTAKGVSLGGSKGEK